MAILQYDNKVHDQRFDLVHKSLRYCSVVIKLKAWVNHLQCKLCFYLDVKQYVNIDYD
jgi:hypothetical protein